MFRWIELFIIIIIMIVLIKKPYDNLKCVLGVWQTVLIRFARPALLLRDHHQQIQGRIYTFIIIGIILKPIRIWLGTFFQRHILFTSHA